MPAIGMAIGAIMSYAAQRETNRSNERIAGRQGYVDLTSTRNPAPGAQPYLDASSRAAYEALFGQPPPGTEAGPRVQGDPRAAATAEGHGKPPAGMRYNKQGKLVKVKGAGGAAAGPAAPEFRGMSPETDEIRSRLMTELPAANEPLVGAGSSFVEDTLEGDSRNPLLGRATSAADAIAEDPRLAAYQDFLMGNLGIGAGNAPGEYRQARQGAGTANPNNWTVDAATGTMTYTPGAGGGTGAGSGVPGGGTGVEAALRRLIAGENPEGWDAAEAGIARKVNEGRADQIRQLRARAVGSGFYGGDLYKELEEGAIAQGDLELADSLAAARFGAYQNALGLGTEYDTRMADIAARERSAAAGTGASAAAAANELALREKLANMGALQDALGLGETGRYGRAGALGDLAGLVSSDQARALSSIPELTGSRRADLGVAGDLSLGADTNRNNFLAARGSERVGMAGVNLGRQELAFDRERFYDPFARISAYQSILNDTYGPYGSETTTGRDTRSVSPPAFSSPWGAALSGAAVGGQVGAAYQARRAPSSSSYTYSPSNESGP